MGSLLHAITLEEKPNFQPTNINFSLFPPPEVPEGKRIPKDQKRELMLTAARNAFEGYERGLH
jgi:folate-dependent tRNA-U54 methylase TrmFO/GidA